MCRVSVLVVVAAVVAIAAGLPVQEDVSAPRDSADFISQLIEEANLEDNNILPPSTDSPVHNSDNIVESTTETATLVTTDGENIASEDGNVQTVSTSETSSLLDDALLKIRKTFNLTNNIKVDEISAELDQQGMLEEHNKANSSQLDDQIVQGGSEHGNVQTVATSETSSLLDDALLKISQTFNLTNNTKVDKISAELEEHNKASSSPLDDQPTVIEGTQHVKLIPLVEQIIYEYPEETIVPEVVYRPAEISYDSVDDPIDEAIPEVIPYPEDIFLVSEETYDEQLFDGQPAPIDEPLSDDLFSNNQYSDLITEELPTISEGQHIVAPSEPEPEYHAIIFPNEQVDIEPFQDIIVAGLDDNLFHPEPIAGDAPYPEDISIELYDENKTLEKPIIPAGMVNVNIPAVEEAIFTDDPVYEPHIVPRPSPVEFPHPVAEFFANERPPMASRFPIEHENQDLDYETDIMIGDEIKHNLNESIAVVDTSVEDPSPQLETNTNKGALYIIRINVPMKPTFTDDNILNSERPTMFFSLIEKILQSIRNQNDPEMISPHDRVYQERLSQEDIHIRENIHEPTYFESRIQDYPQDSYPIVPRIQSYPRDVYPMTPYTLIRTLHNNIWSNLHRLNQYNRRPFINNKTPPISHRFGYHPYW